MTTPERKERWIVTDDIPVGDDTPTGEPTVSLDGFAGIARVLVHDGNLMRNAVFSQNVSDAPSRKYIPIRRDVEEATVVVQLPALRQNPVFSALLSKRPLARPGTRAQ